MSIDNGYLTDRLKRVQTAIAELFRRQCQDGAQTKRLPGGVAACGQFLDELDHDQRGMHGTAAAIRVLGEQHDEKSRSLLSELVKYVKDRSADGMHANSGDIESETPEKIKVDRTNVIKIAELLWAIAGIPAGACEKDELIQDYKQLLNEAQIRGESWGFFLGDQKPSVIPTAYATLGLGRIGEDVTKPRAYLLHELERVMPLTESMDQAAIPQAALCLFVLTFDKSPSTTERPNRQLATLFARLARAAEPLLDADLEQNVAYWRPGYNHYIRIPWQLYHIALAAHYQVRIFATASMQDRMRNLIRSFTPPSKGFRYPHSENHLSTRTCAILFETIGIVRVELHREWLVTLWYHWDHARRFMGSRLMRLLALVAALALAGWACVAFWLTESSSVADLAPSLMAAVVVTLLAFGKQAR